MAKGNLLLGQARGKVGDIVLYRQEGEQISRAHNPHPKNPQSALQLLQRSLLKTSSVAYSFLQEICDHSFQGYKYGTENQSQFVARNIGMMRTQLADIINSGDPDDILYSNESNFAGKESVLPEFMPYIVSQGSVPSLETRWYAVGAGSAVAASVPVVGLIATGGGSDIPTYADVINYLGVQRGDQLTFLLLTIDDTDTTAVFNGFRFARVILEPAGGDITTEFFGGNGTINDPNPRNEGDFQFSYKDAGISWMMSGLSDERGDINTIAAACCIVSRQVGSTWQRSEQRLVLRSYVESVPGHLEWDHGTDYLADAVASFKTENAAATEYLNQAQRGF